MEFDSWYAFYKSDLQSVVLLIVAPACFLAWRCLSSGPTSPGAVPGAASFIRRYSIVFAVLTIVDPLMTGPVTRAFALGEAAAEIVMLCFVLLGDFRVYLLVFALSRDTLDLRGAALEAARWTLLVPLVAWPANGLLGLWIEDLPGTALWLIYEVSFATVVVVLLTRVVPRRVPASDGARRAYLRDVLLFVLAYYTLWPLADCLTWFAGLDAGWLLRVVPNQLYYAFWVPTVFGLFFFRSYQETSASTQAAT